MKKPKVVLTGSSGRVGRAIFNRLAREYEVIGIDTSPASMTALVGDIRDRRLVERACSGASAIIHTAALHAPQVGVASEDDFASINIGATRSLVEAASTAGIERIVYTSTTALYGYAVIAGRCTWIDEETPPQPRTIYHTSKLAAEDILEEAAVKHGIAIRIIRMSRCFPEPAPVMAVYRLHRGVDARDVADAHAHALANEGPTFQRYIVSGRVPFEIEDSTRLACQAQAVIAERVPRLSELFAARGWTMPSHVDRIYSARRAEKELSWSPRFGFDEVIAQLDRKSLEVLPGP